MALRCGADAVFELPLPWAMAGAERFALGGVFLLAQLGCRRICFGSECGDVKALQETASLLLSPAFSAQLKQELSRGTGFASAREAAVHSLAGPQAAAAAANAEQYTRHRIPQSRTASGHGAGTFYHHALRCGSPRQHPPAPALPALPPCGSGFKRARVGSPLFLRRLRRLSSGKSLLAHAPRILPGWSVLFCFACAP